MYTLVSMWNASSCLTTQANSRVRLTLIGIQFNIPASQRYFPIVQRRRIAFSIKVNVERYYILIWPP